MTCINCRKAELVEQRLDMPAEVKGEPVLAPQVAALVCPKCDYKTVSGHQMQNYMRAAADAYREKHNLLTSSQIRDRREALGFTQEQFADHLGIGIASIKRWELGQVQDKAMDKLMRVCTDVTDALQNLRQVERLVSPTIQFWLPATGKWGQKVPEREWQTPSARPKSKYRTAC